MGCASGQWRDGRGTEVSSLAWPCMLLEVLCPAAEGWMAEGVGLGHLALHATEGPVSHDGWLEGWRHGRGRPGGACPCVPLMEDLKSLDEHL